MIKRICISINNRCNLNCFYCHFHEKKISASEMDVFKILDNVREHLFVHPEINLFKIGFVGNGEPFLDFERLKEYVLYIDDLLSSGRVAAYTITNGTLVDSDKLSFLISHRINVGFSIDGVESVHNKLRCGSYGLVMRGIGVFKDLTGVYPSMNCTVGEDVLEHAQESIRFFEQFHNRVTFSRMIGVHGISMRSFHDFMIAAQSRLNVRTGGYDCTMYGGKCAAGIDNLYFANGKVFICGNCVDIPSKFSSYTPLDAIHFDVQEFDRSKCYKELIKCV